MSAETVLVHLLIVLVAARVAAEIAERTGQAAVLLEIVLGILIGPSFLKLIGQDDFLTALGEIGAVLLLFEVGMQMNLRELTRVGGDSLRVAAIGILTPMLLAFPALRAAGMSHTTALFLAGGITATSVGITARVFGDLRSLATPEARTVLGAAVADDVGGLLILTFVVAVSTGGAVSVAALAETLGVAVGFVVFVSIAVIWLAPRVFAAISRRSRAEGTLMVLALAFSLLVARAADAAHLAPIVGAFIAGLAISGSEVRDDVQRRLGPLVQVLVPVFFLQIGIDTRIGVFSDPGVVAVAALLSVIAVAGKIAAGIGVRRGRANRLLVGVAMIPRGEVGLIFAGLGLSGGILSAQTYAVLVVVVLVTTLVTPPVVRQLIVRSRRQRAGDRALATSEAPGQWLVVTDEEVELAAEPSDLLALRLGLDAAALCATREAGPRLVSWLVGAECSSAVWSASEREAFFRLLRSGNVRSWRLLEVTGLLTRCAPTLDEAIARRRRDSFHLDPGADLRFGSLEDLRALVARRPPLPGNRRALEIWDGLEIKDLVLFAALAASLFEDDPDPGSRGALLAGAVGLSPPDVAVVRSVVAERGLLRAAAHRMDMGTEDSILELAAHIGRLEMADAVYVLVVAEGGLEWERERLDEQFELIRSALEHPDLTGGGVGDLVEVRRGQIARELHHLPAAEVARHLEAAPRRYLLSHSPEVVARHLRMTSTPLGRFEVRLEAEPEGPVLDGQWWVHVAVRDRDGLLARIAWALARHGVPVHEAFVSTWADGKAIDVFRVEAPASVDWEVVRQSIAGALVHGVNGTQLSPVEGVVDVDNAASPWYTILEVRAYDRTGLLWRVAAALASAGLRIHAALVTTDDDVAVDVFYVTGADGGKLDDAEEQDVRLALAGRPPRRWRAWRHAPGPEPAAPTGPAPTQ